MHSGAVIFSVHRHYWPGICPPFDKKTLAEWMGSTYADPTKRSAYMEKHFIPNVDFGFDNFEEFFTKREALLFNELKKCLLTNTSNTN